MSGYGARPATSFRTGAEMSETYDYFHVRCTDGVTPAMLEMMSMIRLVDAEAVTDTEILVLVGKTRRSDDVELVRKIIESLPFVSGMERGRYRVSDVAYQGLADAAIDSLKPSFHGVPSPADAPWVALRAAFAEGAGTLSDFAGRLAAWKQLRQAVSCASATKGTP